MAGSEAFQSIPPRKTRPSKALRGQKSRKSHSAFASFSPRSTRLVYHRFKPRALPVNCTPRCTVMPDGDIAFSRLATANQCAGNWPSNGRACIFFLASSLLFSPLESSARCSTDGSQVSEHRSIRVSYRSIRCKIASFENFWKYSTQIFESLEDD